MKPHANRVTLNPAFKRFQVLPILPASHHLQPESGQRPASRSLPTIPETPRRRLAPQEEVGLPPLPEAGASN